MLRFMNEIELIEINRDWSQPNKLNASELFSYKKVVFVIYFFYIKNQISFYLVY